MNDKEFYEECIKRTIFPPVKTKTNIELANILFHNTHVDPSNMFDDKSVFELFNGKGNVLYGNAYKFIRDNQDLYVNSKCMSYSDILKILSDINVDNILKSREFSSEDSQLILNEALNRVQPNVIKHLMQKNIMPRLDTAFFMVNLTEKPEYLRILKYISSKDINLLSLSSGKLIETSTLNNNNECLEYIIQDAPIDMPIIKTSLEQYVDQEYESKARYKATRDDFSSISQNMEPILNTLMSKLSPKVFDNVLGKVKTEEMTKFLKNRYLIVELQNGLPKNSNSSTRLKI
jgi:hypothetical protein